MGKLTILLFALLFFRLLVFTLFFWLIDGSLFPIFYLIFKTFGCFYCFRAKSFFSFSYYDKNGSRIVKHLRDISPLAQHSKVFKDVLFTRRRFKTNIVVPTYSNHSSDDIWYLITNDDTRYASLNYSCRFGSIECIFKSQKSNRF